MAYLVPHSVDVADSGRPLLSKDLGALNPSFEDSQHELHWTQIYPYEGQFHITSPRETTVVPGVVLPPIVPENVPLDRADIVRWAGSNSRQIVENVAWQRLLDHPEFKTPVSIDITYEEPVRDC